MYYPREISLLFADILIVLGLIGYSKKTGKDTHLITIAFLCVLLLRTLFILEGQTHIDAFGRGAYITGFACLLGAITLQRILLGIFENKYPSHIWTGCAAILIFVFINVNDRDPIVQQNPVLYFWFTVSIPVVSILLGLLIGWLYEGIVLDKSLKRQKIKILLTEKKVENIFEDSVMREGDDKSEEIKVHGTTGPVSFHKIRLENHREEILALLSQLPKEFNSPLGAAFHSANSNASGIIWTTFLHKVDYLITLGMAIGAVSFPQTASNLHKNYDDVLILVRTRQT